MNPKKRSLKAFGLLLGSYAVLTFLYVLPIDNSFMLHRTTSVFYFFPAVFITLYFATRIIDRRVRRYLVAVGLMIILWSVLRAAKYTAFQENESIARFIWYLYYVSMLSIPQFSFQAALSVGRPENKKLPAIHILTGFITVACIAVVLTNDLHQKVFSFNPGFDNWDADYRHEPLFWVIAVWDYLLVFVYTVVLFYKCRLLASRRLTWIPLVYLLLGLWGFYLLDAGILGRNNRRIP